MMEVQELLQLLQQLSDGGEEILLADGLEEALIGVTETFEPTGTRYRALYSYAKCRRVFQDQGMTAESADEWMSFNVLGAYLGPGMPSFLIDG